MALDTYYNDRRIAPRRQSERRTERRIEERRTVGRRAPGSGWADFILPDGRTPRRQSDMLDSASPEHSPDRRSDGNNRRDSARRDDDRRNDDRPADDRRTGDRRTTERRFCDRRAFSPEGLDRRTSGRPCLLSAIVAGAS